MAVHTENLTATILIQVGADEPKPIGTIQIRIKMTRGGNQELTVLHNGVPGARGGFIPPDKWLTSENQVNLSEGRFPEELQAQI